ncbi:hypothetical protein CC86DRAFT_193084 [Ophiobolus disseminans]|uniref:Uncharacterized protein n=1 Tax=Ophiobolus disseminans TaxID=1469910 RepID=A0A6A7A6I5_9PLEO|nr:hypothetical protein CC86DRAFT_193084 [Ophiobolus disseminans]
MRPRVTLAFPPRTISPGMSQYSLEYKNAFSLKCSFSTFSSNLHTLLTPIVPLLAPTSPVDKHIQARITPSTNPLDIKSILPPISLRSNMASQIASQSSPHSSLGQSEPHSTVASFPTTRLPYWRDVRVQVVTETRLIINTQGRRVVEKKKYLEYPEGWSSEREDSIGDSDDSR